MVVVPPGRPRDLLAAARTAPTLLLPKRQEVGTILQQAYHLGVGTTLEVRPPGRIIGIRLPLHLDMPSDANVAGIEQPGDSSLATDIGFALEGPYPPLVWPEVSSPDPPGPLAGVPTACPTP